MGQKRKQRPSAEELLETISAMLVPPSILEHFEIYGARETATCWEIELRERGGLIPRELQGYGDVVADGYCNPLEKLSHSFICKPVYLKVYRRRYRRSGQEGHYSNSYDLTLKGVKMVPELGLFLKEED